MTRTEAEAECRRLAAESPDRETHRWVPRSDGGDVWSVVRISLPPAEEASGSEVHADERPATPGDPRTASEQNIGLWAPGAG